MKFIRQIYLFYVLLSIGAVLEASVFNDTLSARLSGAAPPAFNYQYDRVLPDFEISEVEPNVSSLFEGDVEYMVKTEALGRIDFETLNQNSWNALLHWILSGDETAVGNEVSRMSILSLKNDVLAQIITSPLDSQLVGDVMLQIVLDEGQVELWREYVLQHFVIFYEETWQNSDSGYLRDLRDAFQSVLANCLYEDNALCGTSVINLIYLCSSCPEFDPLLILQAATAIAQDTTSPVESRISALQLLGELGGVPESLLASQILNEAEVSAAVKRAALGALKTLPEWHTDVSGNVSVFLQESSHGRLRKLAKNLINH